MAEPQPPTIQDAARELRKHLRLSQQAMATQLGLSMGALRNYEYGGVADPDARALHAYTMAAELGDRPDLAAVFREALYRGMGSSDPSNGHLYIEPKDEFERVLITALLASIRGIGEFQRFQIPVLESLNKPVQTLSRRLPLNQQTREFFNRGVVNVYASCPRQFLLKKTKETK